ncbi:MAG TPA: glycosyltransferase family 2 protein [Polyangia bacterium]|nr:glycosyltransferase family 2 protein [Polyangia bacterium]
MIGTTTGTTTGTTMGSEVSVIVPTYNRAGLIGGALDSVLGQTYPRCHAVVVDDGSTDDTAQVLARYAANPRVQILRQRNRGVAAARNAALAAATGAYVAFLDSDDVWYPWKLAAQVAALEGLAAKGVGMLWTDMDIVDARGQLVTPRASATYYSAYKRLDLARDFAGSAPLATFREANPPTDGSDPAARVHWGDVLALLVRGNLCLTSSVIFTRARIAATGRFEETMSIGDDYDYFIRASAYGPCAYLEASTLAYRRGHADQLTVPANTAVVLEEALRAFDRAVAQNRAGIRMTDPEVRERRAGLNTAIGLMYLDKRDNVNARRYLLRGLVLRGLVRPQQASLAKLLAACLPARATDSLRQLYRLARGAAGAPAVSRAGDAPHP